MPTAEGGDLPAAMPDIAQGAAIFAQNCTDCHGVGGAGDGELVASGQIPNPGNMTDFAAVSVDTPQAWFNIITNGNLENLMPPWSGSLSASQRWSVALYTYTLGYTSEQIEQGQAIYDTVCADGCPDLDPTDMQAMITRSDAELAAALQQSTADLTADDAALAVRYARTLALENAGMIGQVVNAADSAMSSSSDSPAAVDGTLQVTLTNGTVGGEVPQSGDVDLFVLDQQFSPIDNLTGSIEDGAVRFDDLTLSPDQFYVAAYNHRDRQFFSEPRTAMAMGDDNVLNIPLQIYELTEDPAVIEIERMVVQASAIGDGLQVAEVVFFENTSDRLFTSSQALNEQGTVFGSTVLSLPPGAVVAGFGGDERRYVVSEEDFAVIDTQPVEPGTGHTMQVVYFLPYEDGAIIEHQLNYNLNGSARLLLRPDTLSMTSDQLELLGEQTLGENVYTEYGADITLNAGNTLRYELSGRAVNVASGGSFQWLPMLLFVLSGLTGGAAAVLFFMNRRDARTKPQPKPTTNREIDALVTQIAKLDSDHQAGRLNHDLWHQQRNELKAQLRDLMAAESDPKDD